MKKFMILVLCLGVCLALCETDSWAACKGVTSTGNVKGNNSGWTHIGTVTNGSIMKIHASGTVDFGCWRCGCVDSATAGVTGKSLVVVKIFDGLKQEMDAITGTYNPIEATQKSYNALKKLFGSTHQPNFDQGGVWIKVVTKNGTPYLATQLYYFWEHGNGINKYGLPINEDVDVYAKAHDGGKSPDATKSYGDNKGAYTVNIESALIPSVPPPPTALAPTPIPGRVGHPRPVPGKPTPPAPTPVPGASKRLDFQGCTGCTTEVCPAGSTCIYTHGRCFVSCK